MNEESVRKTEDKDGNKAITYRKEWDKDGIRYSKEVRKVEGGYIIRESKYGKPSNDPNAEYVNENKEYVSATNPFDKKKEEEKENGDDKMFSFIDIPTLQ